MTPAEKVEHWLDIADYDLETAAAMQQSGRYLYTVFMCQQALEKLLKAIYLQQKGEEAPRTHNLSRLFKLVDLPEDEKYQPMLARITAFYIKGRYPDYRRKLSQLLDKATSQAILTESEEIFKWLRSQLPSSRP